MLSERTLAQRLFGDTSAPDPADTATAMPGTPPVSGLQGFGLFDRALARGQAASAALGVLGKKKKKNGLASGLASTGLGAAGRGFFGGLF